MKKEQIKKEKSYAFGKDIYLLGQDQDGVNYWLEAPSWDCGWYWGFGYVETYKNNENPSRSRDISSHQHIDSSFMGESKYYDSEKGCMRKGEYIHNIYDSPKLSKVTFDEKEGWQLSELFNQFYLLKKFAGFAHRTPPGCHTTTSPVDHGSLKAWEDEINKVMIPKVTQKIIDILKPE